MTSTARPESKRDTLAPPGSAAAAESRAAIDFASFAALAAQLGLLLALLYVFRIEATQGFVRLFPLIAGGFVINCWLPLSRRPAFFTLLSVSSVLLLLGPRAGGAVIGVGLGMLALCHLPIPFRARVALVIAAGAGLAALRAGWPRTFQLAIAVLPILGSMLMFRLASYLFDLRYKNAACSVWQRISYIFMLPNVCFPLFPVVDFAACRRHYYDAPAREIYQRGLHWTLRGAIHLILYRFVYYFLAPPPAAVTDLPGVALAIVSSYLLYLRISGLFHLIIGILCLFGHNLPETHHLYFLASSVSDFWRRINIYWKDFMMKLFFYPMSMRTKKLGIGPSLVIGAAFVFVCTWALHSYQWFWLRGTFPITAPDIAFWAILGVLVAWNSVRQAKASRVAAGAKREWSFAVALSLSLKTVGMFTVIALLWSLWSAATVSEWLSLLAVGARGTPAQVAGLTALWVGAVAFGVLVQHAQARGLWRRAPAQRTFARSALATAATAALILAAGSPLVSARLGQRFADVALALRENKFNQRDRELLERGYYEALIGAEKFTSNVWEVQLGKPREWRSVKETDIVRLTGDMLSFEFVPSYEIELKRAKIRTNRWGMRDREYEKSKPPSVYRIALLGASYVMGCGVENEEVFEALVERRLNAEQTPCEILNFGIAGYSALECARALETKVLDFAPDLVLYFAHANDDRRAGDALARMVSEGVAIPYDDLAAFQERLDVGRDTEPSELQRRAQGASSEILSWGYRKIAEACRARGAVPVWVYFAETTEPVHAPAEAAFAERARAAGFAATWSMAGVYGENPRAVALAAWDEHPNAAGQEMIAARLYELITREAPGLASRGEAAFR